MGHIMKEIYHICEFEVDKIQEAQDWLNRKAENGYFMRDIYYYVNKEGIAMVRYTLELKENQ